MVNLKNANLLIVEDNDFYRDLFIRQMKNEGYSNVTSAVNGREALELIESNNFDAILLDIMMPEIDGYQVLEKLKTDANLRNIPVIILSAVEEMDSVIKCIELGAEDYLQKPVDSTLLRARLGACLEKKNLRDNEVMYLTQIETAKKHVDELLNIILPSAAISEIKKTGYVKPRRFENVVVLFCDVIGFTNFCDNESPEDIVKHVTELIECFENIVLKYHMEKIKTIGDEFMATANLLESINDPLDSAVECGLEMAESSPKLEASWQVRVGVEYGPVVAGIVGQQKYQFDLWGDTVNTAARMTRYGEPGVVVMTEKTSKIVKDKFKISSIGQIDVKGKGMIDIVTCC